jgi:uncharacterized protein YjdB
MMKKNCFKFLAAVLMLSAAAFVSSCSEDNTTPVVSVSGISAPSTLALFAGDEKVIDVTVSPKDATDTDITAESSNTSVATVAVSGTYVKVTGVAYGTTTVTIKSVADITKKATVEVSVGERISVLELSETEFLLYVEQEKQLSVTPIPGSASTEVTWSSSNPAVATVTDGLVKAVTPGEVVITATSKDNEYIKASAILTVKGQGLDFEASDYEVFVGATVTPTLINTPATATIPVTWESSDPSIASVANGVITGVKPGTVTVTATAVSDPTVVATTTVKVYRHFFSIALNSLDIEGFIFGGDAAAVIGDGPNGNAVAFPTFGYVEIAHGLKPTEGFKYDNATAADTDVPLERINTFTLLVDFRVSDNGGWNTIYTGRYPHNSGDASVFLRNVEVGVSGWNGYNNLRGDYTQSCPLPDWAHDNTGFEVQKDTWYRVVITVDFAHAIYGDKCTGTANIYFDGQIIHFGGWDERDDNRFPLHPDFFYLHADNDSDLAPMDIAHVALWDKCLTYEEVAALGAAGDAVSE